MTREEAITRLHWLKRELIKGTDMNEPLDMAIEALSANPSGDLISRADTLAKIKEYCIDGDSVVQKWFDTMGIEEIINTMPSVSAEPKCPYTNEICKMCVKCDIENAEREWVEEDRPHSVSAEKHQLSEETSTMKVDTSTNTSTDLISRADVLEGLKHSTAYLHDDIYTIVNRIPSAETTGSLDDAIAKYVADGLMDIPVVRCKDCRHRYEEGDCTHYYWCRLNDRPIDDTDFCAWAERREP